MIHGRKFLIRPISWKFVLNCCLVITLLSGQLSLQYRLEASPQEQIIPVLVTIGGLLAAGKLAKDGIDDTLSQVDAITRERLIQAREEIERLIELIEEKYQDNLDLTLDSLDRFAAGQFNRAYNLIIDINQELQRTVGTIEEATLRVIEEAAAQLRVTVDFIAERVEQIVIVAAESGVWIIDNVWETIISVIALLFLVGVLLIAYSQVGPMIRMDRLPSRTRLAAFAGISVFLLVVGLMLLLWQPARHYIMTRSVSALQDRLEVNLTPQIFSVVPNTLERGQETELTIIGANLPTDETPTAQIGSETVPVKIAQDDLVVVTLSAEAAEQSGAQEVRLQYSDLARPLTDIVEFIEQGPDLVIENIAIAPQSPFEESTFQVTVRVRNQGSTVQRFSLEWNLGLPGTASTLDEETPLEQGGVREYNFSSRYDQPNDYQAFARILSSTPSEPPGPNRDNNRLNITITVRPVIVDDPATPTPRPPQPHPDLDDPPVCLRKPYLPQCDPDFRPGGGFP